MQAASRNPRAARARTLAWMMALGSCGGSTGHGAAAQSGHPADQRRARPAGRPGAAATPAPPGTRPPARVVSEAEALRPRDDLPPAQRALAVVDGKERWVDAGLAETAGFTVVDLGDDWTPYIFA